MPAPLRSARVAALALPTLALAACTLLRDFDGFTGGVADAGANRDGDAAQDAASGGCTLEALWASGSTNPAVGPYLRGVATTTDTIYAVAGRYSSPTIADTSGILLSIPKARPATGGILARSLDQPTSIAVGADGAPLVGEQHGEQILRVASDGGTTVVLGGVGPVKDLTVDGTGKPWAIVGATGNTVFGPIDGSNDTPDVDASRIVVFGDTAIIARNGGEGGCTVYVKGAPWTRKCALATGSVVGLAGDGVRMAWSSNATYVAPFGDCTARTTLAPGHALGIGLDAAHVVLRFASEIDVYDTSGLRVCALPLPADEPIAKAIANATVVVERDAAYVVSPVSVYRVRFP